MPRRAAVIRVRVTAEERDAWHRKAQATGRSLSALMREALARVQPWTAGRVDLERARHRELARIGSNLNQLARWANTHKGGVEAVLVLSRLAEVAEAVKALRSTGAPEP